jgi:hypothetical protein
MARTSGHDVLAGAPATSQGLEWLWQHLRDVRRPHILDCARMAPVTLRNLLDRGAKLYVSDVLTLALENEPRFWDRSGKTPRFLTDHFLQEVPRIPPGSLAAILSWNVLDLVPQESHAAFMEHLYSLLEPMGVLFCVLREPRHTSGIERRWWLESLTVSRCELDSQKPFPYPPITNRQVERLLPGASFKNFLTRSGRREVLAMRPA